MLLLKSLIGSSIKTEINFINVTILLILYNGYNKLLPVHALNENIYLQLKCLDY